MDQNRNGTIAFVPLMKGKGVWSLNADARLSASERPASKLVELMLSPFDELTEIDLANDRVRNIRHEEGKYFIPRIDCGFREMFRYCAEYMVHPDDRGIFLLEADPDHIAERLAAGEGGGMLRLRFRYKKMDGSYSDAEQVCVGGKAYNLPDGVYYSFLIDLKHEQDERKLAAEAAVREAADRHSLTGLMLEEQFFRRGQQFIDSKRAEDWCMVVIDLEHFKLFNEWYGREQGDLLLSSIGAKLHGVEQNTGGMACYFGQDDFGVLMPWGMGRIQKLYDDIHDLIKSYGTSIGFMPAFGISVLENEAGSTMYDIYDHAALAARRAKDDYHTRIRVFEASMYLQTDRDYRILSDFQKALRDHELFIQLQPQCQISTGRIVGAESLVRWKKANGEMVSPGIFVPVLEKYGFVTDLDKYVWEEVCIWQKQWIEAGHTPLPVSVNVSQIDIFTIDVPDFFEELIRKYEIPVEVVKIEITESAYVDNEAVADTVQRLREKGFLVLMDDFGSGYSSLNMLRNLNVDIIKLDAQFLRMSGDDRKGIQIMESIVNMAKTMGVPIIVEGVETKEESDFLAGLGCRYVQGYFFYRPMPVPDFEALISDPRKIDTRGFRYKAKEQFHMREFLDQNLFSDTVLNNILGPVAFYTLHDEDVDIVRYNQQFSNELKIPNLEHRTKSIQNYAVPADRQLLYDLLDRAMMDPLSGAEGVLRFFRSDGVIAQLRVRFFYLEDGEDGRKFYGSIHDLTEFITLNDHMRLLSGVTTDSIVFVRERGGKHTFRAVVHGLREAMGLSWKQFQDELTDGRFYRRVEESKRAELKRLIDKNSESGSGFYYEFRITNVMNEPLALKMKVDCVNDRPSGVKYILTIRRSEP